MDNSLDTPLGKITLRAAREGDLETFRELRLEALRENPASYGSDYAVHKAQPKEFWVGRLPIGSKDGKVFFATHKNELIGMCGIMLGTSPKTRHNGTIVSVYVKPDWQGQHIARELIELCANWGREQRVKLLKLAVVANNASAIRCYTGIGFSVYGVDPQAICYEEKYFDELLMSRHLD